MKLNEAGLALLKEFEGCKLKAYRDIVGILTIGYGHTGKDVNDGQVLTQEEADALLVKDLEKLQNNIRPHIKVLLTDNQFSALVVFSYNVGYIAFSGSTLLSKLNNNDFNGAAEQFVRWNRAGGKAVPGLTRRREAEKNLFLS